MRPMSYVLILISDHKKTLYKCSAVWLRKRNKFQFYCLCATRALRSLSINGIGGNASGDHLFPSIIASRYA